MFDRKPHEMNANLKAIGNGFETFAHINPEIDENFEFIFHIIFRQLFRVFREFVFIIKGQESYICSNNCQKLVNRLSLK